jgi:hypothetical protein
VSRRLTIASLVVLALGGFALRSAGGYVADAIGFFIVGVAGVIAIAAVFYAIGTREERERADEHDPPPGE